MSEYEIDDLECPKCGCNTHSRDCNELGCEDGYHDESEEDYCEPGTIMVKCHECKGTGIERWCPKCGDNLSDHSFPSENDDVC